MHFGTKSYLKNTHKHARLEEEKKEEVWLVDELAC
jgi:hypothetical protein